MEFKDYYKIMEVPRDASQDDIRKAYRKLARKYHPDVSKEADAEARMRDINEANDVLRDAEKRAAYDQLAANVSGANGAAPGPGWERGFEFSGGEGQGPSEAEFQDFLNGLFKQAAHQRQAHQRQSAPGQTYAVRGDDHHAEIEVSLEDSFSGATRDLGLRSVQLDAQGRPQVVNRTLSVKIPVGFVRGR
jgi:curved DNA-binding protein